MNPQQAFAKAFDGQNNFMTPNIIKIGQKGNYFYELSSGKDFDNNIMYGVTFLEKDTLENMHNLNNSFQNLDNALKHIKGIK